LAQASAGKAPLGRLVTQAEVAALCTFLVSDAASGMTGTIPFVDAGAHLID
jgi:enoyl-[acyl-carrier protein] reductase I